jgi:hypothetical protein
VRAIGGEHVANGVTVVLGATPADVAAFVWYDEPLTLTSSGKPISRLTFDRAGLYTMPADEIIGAIAHEGQHIVDVKSTARTGKPLTHGVMEASAYRAEALAYALLTKKSNFILSVDQVAKGISTSIELWNRKWTRQQQDVETRKRIQTMLRTDDLYSANFDKVGPQLSVVDQFRAKLIFPLEWLRDPN